MKKYKILYAEDDETLAFLTKDNLEQYYDVFHCSDGKSCFDAYQKNDFDICIFDIMLPTIDGFELATKIRLENSEIPILFLSAKTLKEDRLKGLRLGADDYLIKPFSIEELILKIEIFLKRSHKSNIETHKNIGKFIFDFKNYRLKNDDAIVKLTQREAELLNFFIENQNTVLKREQILQKLWGDDDYFMGRSLDVFVSRLRKIFIDDDNISIENIHSVGFRFNVS